MKGRLAEPHRLFIRRFESEYLVPRNHPAPVRVRLLLDEIVKKQIGDVLAIALQAWVANSDSSFWLIRHLNLELAVNMDSEPEHLARIWATQITRSLALTIQGGSDGENVLWFPNRAAYLARFLIDVADGRAWSKWCYESFAGLKLLPVSAVVRTAVREQSAIGEEALRQLPETELKNVFRILTAADARHILELFAAEASGSDEFSSFEAAWAALDTSEWESFDFGGEWQNSLRLYLAASQTAGGGLELKTAVLALLRLANLLGGGSGIQSAALVEVLARGDMAALYAMAGGADA